MGRSHNRGAVDWNHSQYLWSVQNWSLIFASQHFICLETRHATALILDLWWSLISQREVTSSGPGVFDPIDFAVEAATEVEGTEDVAFATSSCNEQYRNLNLNRSITFGRPWLSNSTGASTVSASTPIAHGSFPIYNWFYFRSYFLIHNLVLHLHFLVETKRLLVHISVVLNRDQRSKGAELEWSLHYLC